MRKRIHVQQQMKKDQNTTLKQQMNTQIEKIVCLINQ